MKSLFNFILESLIEKSDLRENLKFSECSGNDIKKMLSTTEYNHGKDLGLDSEDDFDTLLFHDDKNTHWYKLIYNDDILGFTGINYLNPDTANIKETRYQLISHLFSSNLLIDAYNYRNKNDMLKDSAYIIGWQLSDKIKKKIDVNPIALLKVFYEKLIEIIKSNNCKIICAHGKDSHRTKNYIKAGGFDSYKDKFLIDRIAQSFRSMKHVYETFVIKKI